MAPSTRLEVAAALAAFGVLWLPSFSPHYGFYSDEFYYLACAERLAFGYVDHPPLFPALLRLHREVFGDSLQALRALPAAAGALVVYLTGHMARRMGGGLYAQALAMLALLVGQSLVIFGIFTVNCLAVLGWTTATWIYVELCRSRDPRLWIALGGVLGLSFLAKHTILVLAAALAVGTVLGPLRSHLARREVWLGAALFALLALPNLLWQVAHDWPSVDFYRIRAAGGTLDALEVFGQQIGANNPFAAPVWIAALVFFFHAEAGRRFRPLGWAFATAFALAMAGGQPTPYRILGIYPVAFAAGGVLLASLRRRPAGLTRRAADTVVLPAMLVVGGLAAASLLLPLLPPQSLLRHPLWDGEDGWRDSTVAEKRIPYHLGNRIHWRDYVALVSHVVDELPPEERAHSILLADYFGHAGALEYYGRGLPPVYSQHTGYFLWGPPAPDARVAVVSGFDDAFLAEHFERVRVGGVFGCALCPGWLDGMPIYVATGPKRPWPQIWRAAGEGGGMQRFHRLLRERSATQR